MDPMLSNALEILAPLGFRQIEGQGMMLLGKAEIGQASIIGLSIPTDTHRRISSKFLWWQGPLIMVSEDYIVMEPFFCLESGDIPLSLLDLRDFFDYGQEVKLRTRFSGANVSIGPQWIYVYECPELQTSLQNSSLLLSSPLVGNMIHSRGKDLLSIIEIHNQIKSFILETVPLPFIWGYPEDIPFLATDNVYDPVSQKWYTFSLKGPFAETISIIDVVRGIDRGAKTFERHDPNKGEVTTVTLAIDDVTLHIKEVAGNYQRRRKLSRLGILIL